nr:pentapeptide repeat-containing protein [Leptolyngbyaceae cyanobacterium MO_188.B28]
FTQANLSRASLSETELSRADLSEVNLSKAILNVANLSEANLNCSDLHEAELLGANLNRASLCRTNLRKADLSKANLSRAHLSEAYLVETRLLSTSLWQALLTGAYISDWSINSETDLNEVICNYIYSQNEPRIKYPFNRDFSADEFARFVRQIDNTTTLVFEKHINWQFFLYSLEELRSRYDHYEFLVIALEKKDNDILLVRITIPPDSNREGITKEFTELYHASRQTSEKTYARDESSQGRQGKASKIDLLSLIKLAARSLDDE